MRLKNFSLVLTALAMFAGSNAFAYEYRVMNQPAVLTNSCMSQPAVVTDSCLSQPAVVAAPAAIPGPILGAPIIRSGKTIFDLQLLGLDLLHIGLHRRAAVAATQSLSQVVAPECAPAACAPATIQQPAVIPQPQPETINLHDTITTTTVTRLYRRTHIMPRVIKHKKHRARACNPAASGS